MSVIDGQAVSLVLGHKFGRVVHCCNLHIFALL